MAIDPIAKERVGHANDQGFARTVEPEPNISAEPEGEARGTNTFGDGRSQRFLQNRRTHGAGVLDQPVRVIVMVPDQWTLSRQYRASQVCFVNACS